MYLQYANAAWRNATTLSKQYMSIKLPLVHLKGHLFLKVDDALFLIDTGAPSSFGNDRIFNLGDSQFILDDSYLGLDTDVLSQNVGTDCAGLIGVNILNCFDTLFDHPNGQILFSEPKMRDSTEGIPLSFCMGIPKLEVTVNDTVLPMFLDTGAQVSYLKKEFLNSSPSLGQVEDFYPGLGTFQTSLHKVDIELNNRSISVRTGSLPTLLHSLLAMGGASGILGNEVFLKKRVGYFPGSQRLVFYV